MSAQVSDIEHLIIVAGPKAAGKSTLMQRLANHKLPALSKALGIGDFSSWTIVDKGIAVPEAGDSPLRCIGHHGIYRVPRSDSGYDRHNKLTYLRRAQNISFITLWTPPERLLRQRFDKEIYMRRLPRLDAWWIARQLFRNGQDSVDAVGRLQDGAWPLRATSKRFIERYAEFYGSPINIRRAYDYWLDFTDGFEPITRHHLIVEYDRELTITPRQDWAAPV